MPERRQKPAVSSRRGAIQPHRPMTTRMAGRSVSAARNATPTPTAEDTPTVENTPILAKLIAKGEPYGRRDAVMTLPTEPRA